MEKAKIRNNINILTGKIENGIRTSGYREVLNLTNVERILKRNGQRDQKNDKADEDDKVKESRKMVRLMRMIRQDGDERPLQIAPKQICINVSNTKNPFQQKIPVSFRDTDQSLIMIQLMGRYTAQPFYNIFYSISHIQN